MSDTFALDINTAGGPRTSAEKPAELIVVSCGPDESEVDEFHFGTMTPKFENVSNSKSWNVTVSLEMVEFSKIVDTDDFYSTPGTTRTAFLNWDVPNDMPDGYSGAVTFRLHFDEVVRVTEAEALAVQAERDASGSR